MHKEGKIFTSLYSTNGLYKRHKNSLVLCPPQESHGGHVAYIHLSKDEKNRKDGRSWGQNSLIGAEGITVGIRGLDLILDTSGYLPGGFRWPFLTLNKWMKSHNEQNVRKLHILSMQSLFVFQQNANFNARTI